jgi:hypothetical protein
MKVSNLKMPIAAALLVAGGMSANAAQPVVAGHYYTDELTDSLTAKGGAVQADCEAAYPGAGSSFAGITVLTWDAKTGLAQLELRQGQPAKSGGLGFARAVFAQSAGSTFAKQKGTETIYENGVKAVAAPYTATTVTFDNQSFYAQVTATFPSPTGTGTCVQVTDVTFVHSAGY